MISSFVRALVSAFKARRELALENVALRQQLAVLPRSVKRPRVLGAVAGASAIKVLVRCRFPPPHDFFGQ